MEGKLLTMVFFGSLGSQYRARRYAILVVGLRDREPQRARQGELSQHPSGFQWDGKG